MRKIFYTLMLLLLLFPLTVSAKVVIGDILFKGNHFFTAEKLREAIQSQKSEKFDARLIKVDNILLKNLYISSGFLDVSVEDSIGIDYKKKDRKIFITYKIDEGKRYYFERVDVSGNKIFSTKYIKSRFSGFKKGVPFNQQIVNDALQKIERSYYNKGKPYIDIKTTSQIMNDSLIVIKVKIAEYMNVYIKKRIYLGLDKVQRFIVTRESEFKRNQLYNREKIEKSQKNLYKTGLFEYVRIELEPIENVPDSVNIIVRLKEKNRNWFGVHLGFAYEEEDFYGNKINVTLQGGNRNLFGTARSLSLHLTEGFQLDFNEKKFINAENEIFLRFVEPWIFATKSPGVFQINYRLLRPINSAPYNLLTTSLAIEHEYGEWIKGGMMFSLKHVNNLTDGVEQIENYYGLNPDQSMIYSFTFTLKRNRLDHFFNPKEGSRTLATIGLSDNVYYDNGKKHSIYTTLTGSWSRYQPWRPVLFNFLPRFHFVYATRLRIGNLFVLNNNDYIPQNDLFFAGGASTVRGYREQLLGPAKVLNERGEIIEAAGGKFIFLANIEARMPLFWLLMMEVFIDSGNVWRRLRDFNPLEIRFTTGAGIALLTPIGPVRVDYGFKLNRPSTNPWPGAWHLGFYFAF